MPTTTFAVDGMSCQHCIDAVTAEVDRLAGVAQVDVDLDAGTVAVASAEPLDPEAVRSAIDEAGFDLADPASTESTEASS